MDARDSELEAPPSASWCRWWWCSLRQAPRTSQFLQLPSPPTPATALSTRHPATTTTTFLPPYQRLRSPIRSVIPPSATVPYQRELSQGLGELELGQGLGLVRLKRKTGELDSGLLYNEPFTISVESVVAFTIGLCSLQITHSDCLLCKGYLYRTILARLQA